MKRFFSALLLPALLLLVLLASCNLGGGVDPSRPVAVNTPGAKSLFLSESAAPRGARSISGDGLLQLLQADNTSEPASFTDGAGEPVDVTLSRTLQLDADHLLVEYTTAEALTGAGVVVVSTGQLVTLSSPPDNWDRIRVKAGTAYWVSGGALHKTDLASLAAVDMSQGDRISGSSLLFLDSSDNVHSFYLVNGMLDPANQIRIYYADGSPPDTLGWGSPDAYLLYESYGSSTFEDQATGRVYRITAGAGGLATQEFTFDASGVYSAGSQSWDAAYTYFVDAVGPATGKAYLDNVALQWPDNGQALALTLDGSGAVTGTVKRTGSSFYGQPTRYVGGRFYVASTTGISSVELATGTTEAVLSASGITDFEVVEDQVFYSTATGVYQYDTVSATAAPFTGGQVEAVIE